MWTVNIKAEVRKRPNSTTYLWQNVPGSLCGSCLSSVFWPSFHLGCIESCSSYFQAGLCLGVGLLLSVPARLWFHSGVPCGMSSWHLSASVCLASFPRQPQGQISSQGWHTIIKRFVAQLWPQVQYGSIGHVCCITQVLLRAWTEFCSFEFQKRKDPKRRRHSCSHTAFICSKGRAPHPCESPSGISESCFSLLGESMGRRVRPSQADQEWAMGMWRD